MKALRLLLKSLAGTIIFLSVLFISAGRLTYWQGWLYAATNLILVLVNTLALPRREGLAKERSEAGEGTQQWDKRIVALSALTLILTYIVAGLDAGPS